MQKSLTEELEAPIYSLFGKPIHSSNGTLYKYRVGSSGIRYGSPIYTTEHHIYDAQGIKLETLITSEEEDYVKVIQEFIDEHSGCVRN